MKINPPTNFKRIQFLGYSHQRQQRPESSSSPRRLVIPLGLSAEDALAAIKDHFQMALTPEELQDLEESRARGRQSEISSYKGVPAQSPRRKALTTSTDDFNVLVDALEFCLSQHSNDLRVLAQALKIARPEKRREVLDIIDQILKPLPTESELDQHVKRVATLLVQQLRERTPVFWFKNNWYIWYSTAVGLIFLLGWLFLAFYFRFK